MPYRDSKPFGSLGFSMNPSSARATVARPIAAIARESARRGLSSEAYSRLDGETEVGVAIPDRAIRQAGGDRELPC